MAQALDAFGRPLRDLRISVTDRCNFRCTYCMPKEVFGHDYRFLDRKELLDFDEITRVARSAVALGVKKIRLTGGEPLIRRDLERLIAMLSVLDAELTLTTNASLLPRKAQALKDAGLDRITVSLDAMDDPTFRAMNDVDFSVQRVLDGIEAARTVGLPVKVNCVVKRSVNESQIVPMARYFRETGDTVRFIEFMDVGATNHWRMDEVVSASEIIKLIGAEFPIEPAAANYRGEAVALPGRQGRDRDHRVGHPALLRRLHPLAYLGRGEALHLPVRTSRPRPPGARPLGRHGRGAELQARRDLEYPRRPLLRAPLRAAA
jgi:cyclic pyranopterin phosphate synthase